MNSVEDTMSITDRKKYNFEKTFSIDDQTAQNKSIFKSI